uniref:L-2-hydroxyglutarate dehydrogenase, mitochondrial n=1 Tax=Clastoptera arizonana TaxID=38151 RepID=A0A1B6C7V0_9HEMI
MPAVNCAILNAAKSCFIKNVPKETCFLHFKHTLRHLSTHNVNEPTYDLVVVGGGIVGLATARELKIRHPNMTIAVLEKEPILASHQTGHNSGVIHAGIYYKPGSLRAKLCVEGLKLTYEFCDKHNIPYKKVGKLIVATDESEIPRLNDLYDRGIKNSVPDISLIDGGKIKDYEPYCKGVKAIHSPHTGIVDWAEVARYYGKEFVQRGGEIHTSFAVNGFQNVTEGSAVDKSTAQYPVRVTSKSKSVRCSYVLTCGGLQSDHIAEMSGASPEPRIVPFRGEYLFLNPEKNYLVKGNIYPVPDPRFPFLGVHFTPRMDGSVWLGPNAVLAFKREGYRWRDFDFGELMTTLKYSGFRRLALKYVSFGSSEIINSVFPSLQVKVLQKYIPEITAKDISRGPSGVRAQALDKDGNLIEDFVFSLSGRILHCRNAPSPGATSSLAIAKMLADKLNEEFKLH